MSKLCVYNSDELEEEAISGSISSSEVNTSFDVSNGTAGTQVSISWEKTFTEADKSGTSTAPVFTVYQLASTDEAATLQFDLDVYDGSGSEVQNTISATNVPIRANYVTHLRGGLSLVASQQFSITVDKEWAGDDETPFGE
ncbi:hypothetical protein [Bacteroides sp. 519]|uniref:hypothetical protein n=1 Tax=Bacteroides sp. 519 TaxID=2302937 RepID=UPI0013D21F4E|nr:hypothetical protein [Bacteroides sp. 519]NDV58473.1 hypothetical protein [Bacteroides sp. 519]